MSLWKVMSINLFVTNIPTLLLKTLEGFWFSDVFRGYKMGILLAINGLSNLLDFLFLLERMDQGEFWKRETHLSSFMYNVEKWPNIL